MTSAELFCLLADLDDTVIAEAHEPVLSKRPALRRLLLPAACLLLLTVTLLAFGIFYREAKQPPIVPPSPSVTTPDPITPPAYTIDRASLSLNDLDNLSAAAMKWYDPALYDRVTWSLDEVKAYYGENILPPYSPYGLTPTVGSRVVIAKTGEVEVDSVRFFYQLTEDDSRSPSIHLTVSRLGYLGDCIYLLPDSEVKTSLIADIPVTFGRRTMEEGPYDPVTREPASAYELYTAEFTHKGIDCQIVAERMDFDEVIKLTASILTGERDIVLQ